MKDIIPLQHHGQFLTFQEAMRQLCIPNQLVGIKCLVAVSSFAEHVYIRRQVGTPREGNFCITSIREIPGREIVGSLQPVFGLSIGRIAIE